MKKIMATVAAGALMITLAGCANSSSSAKKSSSNDASSSKVVKSAKTSGKTAATSTKQSKKVSESSSSSSEMSSNNSTNSVATDKSATSSSEQNTRGQMTAQDAKNIVKEHIGNQLNNAGISGKPATGLPSIDEVDGYTAVQNGVNDWTVSCNGHSFRVTATSVTGK